ncbi:DUF4296 domain-containing protein [Niabella insulamsoli]|uniref:DUF4296 domain-containing protein n=1 Tax=Niabella insulamsoli TaxID=3144874 RepID=UPI0031FCEE9F
MISRFGVFIICCLFISCGQENSDVLPASKMEKVLWDVAQSSEFLNGFVYYKYPTLNRAALNDAMLDRVLKVHKVSRKQFDQSMEWYQQHPKKLMVVIDSITSRQKRPNGTDTSAQKGFVPGEAPDPK